MRVIRAVFGGDFPKFLQKKSSKDLEKVTNILDFYEKSKNGIVMLRIGTKNCPKQKIF